MNLEVEYDPHRECYYFLSPIKRIDKMSNWYYDQLTSILIENLISYPSDVVCLLYRAVGKQQEFITALEKRIIVLEKAAAVTPTPTPAPAVPKAESISKKK